MGAKGAQRILYLFLTPESANHKTSTTTNTTNKPIKTNKTKMKKHYTEPAIDLIEMEVEQGIAESLISGGGEFNLNGYDEENIVDVW